MYFARLRQFGLIFLFFLLSSFSLRAQTQTNLFCQAAATPVIVRIEGLAEKMGDIILNCSGGTPGFMVSGNIAISLAAPITNRLTAGTATNLQLFIDTGAGPVAAPFTPLLTGITTVSLNGISFTIPPSGNVVIRISNLRGSMAGASAGLPINAFVSLNGLSTVSLLNNGLVVAIPQRGLLSNTSDTVIRCVGTPLPANMTSLAAFFAVGTHFESTRLTEGYAADFEPRGATDSAGTRFLISYKNVPPGVLLFVPDVVAGSDAMQPTAGGDLGESQAGGQYTPGSHTLVLARVQGADSTGNGGSPITLPAYGASGSFDGVTQLTVSGGSAYVVYEVLDSNDTVQENAQFPTFVGLASSGVAPGTAQETESFAPVSTDTTANSSAPTPRFTAVQPPSDCQAVGDCNATYFPGLVVFAQPIFLTAFSGGLPLQPPGYIAVQNINGPTSVLNWTASVAYKTGAGWITLETTSGVNNGSVRVFASAVNLAAGTYDAVVTIDAGAAGNKSIPVEMIVTALPTPTPTPLPPVPTGPTVSSIVNAANFLPGPVVAGSLAAINGARFTGKVIAVTFDGSAATLISTTDTQIIVLVPDSVGTQTSSQVVVTVDGTHSPAMAAALAPIAPAIFIHGVLNQDFSPNTATSGAALGSTLQLFVTGLPENTGTVLVQIADRQALAPTSAGPAPGLPGVQVVDVTVPQDLTAMTTTTAVCGYDPSGNPVCSAAVPVTLVNAPQ